MFGGPFTFFDSSWDNNDCILTIYDVPITEEYQAPVVTATSRSTTTDSKFGVRVLSGNKGMDINSHQLSDFSLNTASKALSIHKTGTMVSEDSTGFKAKIQHDLGAPPNFVATYTDYRKTFVGPLAPDFIPMLASADGQYLTFRGAQAALVANVAYIIFKEFADIAV